jgi:hypothetical protein
VATTRNPALASSTEVSKPKPLEDPVMRATLSDTEMSPQRL